MQRRMTVTLAGEEVTLAATFDAAAEVMEKVADPLSIARDAATEQAMAAAGMVYDAKFKWTVRNVPQVIHIGMKAAGDKRSLKDVQELAFQDGIIQAAGVAIRFITMLVTPQSEELDDDKEDGGAGE